MHIIDKLNSFEEKFWSVHEFMQIYYLFRSSGTVRLKSRINKRLHIFSVFKYYKTIMSKIIALMTGKKLSAMVFLLFPFSLLSGVTAERNRTDFPDRVTICI